ncbi:MAG: VWA domain-containing protein [Acidobacteriota bacterium]
MSLIVGPWVGEGRAAARTTQAPAPDNLPAEVGLVTVEVVVTDDRQNPVRRLPAEAFRLTDDGERQRLVSFRAVDLLRSKDRRSAPPGPPRVSTNAFDANATPRRAFVVVFDDGHLSPAGALQAKEVVSQFITKRTRPGDRVILVVPEEGLVRSVVMPDGRAPLADLVSSLRARREAVPALADDAQVLERARSRRQRLLNALTSTLKVLPAPRARKSVLLVSEGFIHDPRDRPWYDVIAASQRANAAVYFLDMRRLAAGGQPDELGQGAIPDPSPSAPRDESPGAETLADLTGGFSVQSVNDLTRALARVSQDASHHYLLGYRPSGRRHDGRMRRIAVAVDRRDAVVRARKGYWDGPDTERDPGHDNLANLEAPLREALASPTLMRQIPLRLTALALAPTDDGRVQVAVAAEARASALRLEAMPDGSHGGTLDVVLAIDHVRVGASRVASPERLAVRVPEGAPLSEEWLPLRRRFSLPPGPSLVRLVVRDRASGAIGTVTHPLQVPDADRLRVSSPILSDIRQGEGVKPPRIVARRSFMAWSILYCYFEVFPGALGSSRESAQARSGYEIVDGRGDVRHRAALPLAVRGDRGGLARLVAIPLTRIEPGEYELVLDLGGDVSGGAAELREPFSVVQPPEFSNDLYRGALIAYLEGDFERAITTLLPWPPTVILKAFDRLPVNGEKLVEAGVLLHTDLALLLQRYGQQKDAERNLTIGRRLLEGAALPELHREWLLALAYAHQAKARPAEALAFYTECARAFPEAGEARLGAGTLYERAAFPDGLRLGNLHVSPLRAAREAEGLYREALRVEPSLTEARLRLARVLQRTDRADEALSELTLVVDSSEDASLRALAHLFWGQIHEARGEVDGAVERYRAALDADRDLQVAALALAQILHRRDGREAAADALVSALGDEGGTTPWLAYRQGPQRLSALRLCELRSRLRAIETARR